MSPGAGVAQNALMRAVGAFTRAGVRSRWRGMVGVALLLGLAGGVVLTTVAGARRTDSAYARLLRASDAADVNIAVSGPNAVQNIGHQARFYEAVARLPGVDVVAPTVGVSAEVAGGHTEVLLRGGTDDRLGRRVERPKLTAGRLPDPRRPDEALADRAIAHELHLHAGDVLHLRAGPAGPRGLDPTRSTDVVLHIVGVGVTRDNVLPISSQASEPTIQVTPALLHRLGTQDFVFDSALVRLAPGGSIAAFHERVEALLPDHPETGGQLFVVDERQQAARVTHDIHPQAVALLLFGGLVTLTGGLIAGQAMLRQVHVASEDHATLRALGGSRAQLAWATSAECALTATLGAGLSVAAAIALSALMPIGPARVAEPDTGVAIDVTVLALGALAIVVAFSLGLVGPVWRLVSRREEARAVRRSRVIELVRRSNIPVSAAVGASLALDAGRGRSAVPTRTALAGAVVAVAAMAAALTFGSSLVRLVHTPTRYGQTWQASVDLEFDRIATNDAAAVLRRQRGVTGWTFGTHGDATIGDRQVSAIALTTGQGPILFPTLLQGRNPRTTHEIVLGTTTLSRIHHQVGEVVDVALLGQPGSQRMRVVGRAVFPFFGQGETTPTGLGEGAAVLAPPGGDDGANFFLLALSPPSFAGDRVNALAAGLDRAGLCPQHCSVVTDQRPSDVRNYGRVRSTPTVLAAVLAAMAIASVAHLLVTGVSRRRRDLAMLGTFGLLRRQLSTAVIVQAVVLVAMSLLVGLPLGVAAGRLIWESFAARSAVAPDPAIPSGSILAIVPIALVVAGLVALVPAWMAHRLRPSVELRRA